ncbi:MAG: hypothetical protein WA971_02220 [Microbacterium sp.]
MSGALRRIATSAFVALPYQIADRIHPWRRRMYRETAVTAVEADERTLLIGPVNSAGQGYAWARAAELLPGVTAVNLMYRGTADRFGFPADHSVRADVASGVRRWQEGERRAIESAFTHVIVESGAHLFDTHVSMADHLRSMADAGISVALLFHGSDIRRPRTHARSEPDSPFRDGQYDETELLETITSRNHALIEQAGLPVFVSTPDLLLDVPNATWLPVVVQPERWSEAAPQAALERPRPVVVHAPSRAGLKGSALIEQVVHRLHDDGIIEYREVQGVPANEMPRVYGDSDVVLDQFSLGIYGVAACEAMAAGRLVVSHVSDFVRSEVRARTGADLPILESTAADLERVLRDIAAHRERYAETASAGTEFVRRVHDGRASAGVLGGFLGRPD